MPRMLMHAGALLCALAVAAVTVSLTHPTAAEAVAIILSLAFLSFGLCAARTERAYLIASVLAALGLLLVVFSTPADAASRAVPQLTAIEAPMQPLVLGTPRQPVVVAVAAADPDVAASKSVALPLAEWISVVQGTLVTVLLGLLGKGLAKLPAPLVWVVRMYGEEKIVNQAIALAVNAVPGVARGAPLNVEVGSSVLAHALQWIVDNVPKFAVSAMGGEDGIKAKIFAALHLEPDVSAAAMGVKATA